MKKIVLLAVTAIFALEAYAQRPDYEFTSQRHLPQYEFRLPDSLSHMVPWEIPLDHGKPKAEISPVVPMSSVVLLQGYKRPRRVTVIDHSVLETPHLTLSNGQGWNWSPFPDSFLDARTISVPGPR